MKSFIFISAVAATALAQSTVRFLLTICRDWIVTYTVFYLDFVIQRTHPYRYHLRVFVIP